MTTPGRQRVGQRIADRRESLGLTQAELATAAGITERRLQDMEAGRGGDGPPSRARGWAGVEDALGWVKGSCRRIYEGHEPMEVQLLPGAQVTEKGTSAAVAVGEDPQALALEMIRLAEKLLSQQQD